MMISPPITELPSLDDYVQLLQRAGRARWHGGMAEGGGAVIDPRLPLKRRLVQFRETAPKPDDRFETGLWAVEKFRDLLPAFVMAIFPETLFLEPGDVGPIPHDSPMGRELIWCVNRQLMTAALGEALREMGVPFCEGGIVVGIVDYRRTALGLLGNTAPARGDPQLQQAVEMHKIYLKPSWDSLQADAMHLAKGLDADKALELEAQLLLACTPALCLEANPAVFRVRSLLEMEKWKYWAILHDTLMQPPKRVRSVSPSSLLTARGSVESQLEDRLYRRNQVLSRPMQRLLRKLTTTPVEGLCNLIQDARSRQQASLSTAQFGLDVKRDPGKAGLRNLSVQNITDWVPAGQRLWRSIRFERTQKEPLVIEPEPFDTPSSTPMFAQPPPKSNATPHSALDHAYLHLLVNFSNTSAAGIPVQQQITGFEGVLRLGSQPFTAADGHLTRFKLATRPYVDALVEQIKQTMQLENRTCVADVANPTILNPANRLNVPTVPSNRPNIPKPSLVSSGSASVASSGSQSASQINLLKKPAKKK